MDKSFVLNIIAATFFALAILHTFLVKQFRYVANLYPSGSVAENFFHLLGEVEVVFGFWAGLYLVCLMSIQGSHEALGYLESCNFTEPAFVFVIMTVCSTKPILDLAKGLLKFIAKIIPLQQSLAFFITTLIVGPLLGSFITEPAAMTVTALILFDSFYNKNISQKLMYATIGLLFVNISIGGTLTPFAAPPVLMVAAKWGWDLSFMLTNFGWKAILACSISTLVIAFRLRKEISRVQLTDTLVSSQEQSPIWVHLSHLLFLAVIVASAHFMVLFVGIFLFFLGFVNVTKEYQSEIRLKEGLLVGFFLGGVVVLGAPQRWWLEPVLTSLTELPLYLGSVGLTAFTDNAALTYLGSQVPNISVELKYALVAGSVVGGGLTVIANAPNPAGFGILNPAFGADGINPFRLFFSALLPTIIAATCFWFL
jgi:Na+/H+ antiporter NhaD/arsenite permease-like protein